MLNKKAFTLIELLAVILILGIIALIAIPTITSTVEDSKKGTLKMTTKTITDVAEQQCQIEQMKGIAITKSYTINNGVLSSPLDVKNIPNSGTISLDNECNAKAAIMDNDYCVRKNGEDISISSNINRCSINEFEIPAIEESCFIFNETTHTITGYNFDNSSCPSEVSIPATINGISVEHIGERAFVNTEYQYVFVNAIVEETDNTYGDDDFHYYNNDFDLIENAIKLGNTDYSYIELINVNNEELKKKCYYLDDTYDEKDYDYTIKDSDSYYGCYFDGDKYEYILPVNSNGITAIDFSKATNLIDIGDNAFYRNEITHVNFGTLPNLISLGNSSFTSNYISGELDLSGLTGLTKIDNSAFYGNHITSINFPSTLTEVGYHAFGINEINSLDLPSTLNNIKAYAFYMNHIKTLTIPSNVNYIMDSSFRDNDIDTLTLNSNMKTISAYSFADNDLSTLNLDDNILAIDDHAFENNAFEEIELPNSIKYLSGFCDNSITSVNIPASVTTIGSYAFSSDEISELSIPNTVKEIYYGAFSYNKITTLSLGSNLIYMGIGSFAEGRDTISSVTIPSGITGISPYAFNNTKINTLTIGDNVKTIGNYAFFKSKITTLNWGTAGKLTTIGDKAFESIQVDTIDIPNGVTSIGDASFHYTKASLINIPDTVTIIKTNAFAANKYYYVVNIGSGIETIKTNAFACYNDLCKTSIININRAENTVSGHPWGNSNAEFNWTGTK